MSRILDGLNCFALFRPARSASRGTSRGEHREYGNGHRRQKRHHKIPRFARTTICTGFRGSKFPIERGIRLRVRAASIDPPAVAPHSLNEQTVVRAPPVVARLSRLRRSPSMSPANV